MRRSWLIFLLLALAVHLLVLFGLPHWQARSAPPEQHYVDITLVAPPPLPPAPAPAPTPPVVTAPAPGPDAEGNPATPPSPPPAMAQSPTPEAPGAADMAVQAADHAGPDTPGALHGQGGGSGPGGGGSSPYIVVWAPEGITWFDAQIAALAWGGRLANLQSAEEEAAVFALADDPKFWVDAGNGAIGPWLDGDFNLKRHENPYGTANTWGAAFTATAPGARQAKAGYTPFGALAHGFVVRREQFKVRAQDVSVGRGRLGNHTFEVFVAKPPGLDWFDAQMQAEARGGYLAVIHTRQENDFVYHLCAAQPGAWTRAVSYNSTSALRSERGPEVSFRLGPWLGGLALWDQAQPYYIVSPTPDSPGEYDGLLGTPAYLWFHLANSPDATDWQKGDPIPMPPSFLKGILPPATKHAADYEGDTGIQMSASFMLKGDTRTPIATGKIGLPPGQYLIPLRDIFSGIKLSEWVVHASGWRPVASWAFYAVLRPGLSYVVEYDDPPAGVR